MISHSLRLDRIAQRALEMGVPFTGESNGAYLARAVSSVPETEKEKLESVFQEIIVAVQNAGLEARLPVELKGINPNLVNPGNHELLFGSRFVVPLTYATSDGRGWEMGFSYAIGKVMIPVLLPEQENPEKNIKPNVPSLRLPFQIPVFFEEKDGMSGGQRLTNLLKDLMNYKIGFGFIDQEPRVIGYLNGSQVDLREKAAEHMRVLSYQI